MEMNKKPMVLFSAAVVCLAALSSVLYVRQRSAGFFPGMKAARYRFLVGQPRLMDNQIPLLEKRTQRNPTPFDLTELSNFYFQQGHQSGDLSWFDKAEDAAKKSLALLAAPNGAKLTLAKIADARHEFPEAIRLAKEVLREKPTSGANMVLISSNLAMGNLAEAAKYADQAVTALPDLSAYMMRALVMAAQGRDEARRLRFSAYFSGRGPRRLYGCFENESSVGALPASPRGLSGRGGAFRRVSENRAGEPSCFGFKRRDGVAARKLCARSEVSDGCFHCVEADAVSDFLRPCESAFRGSEYCRRGEENGGRNDRAELVSGRYGHRLDLVTVLLDRGDPQDVREAVELAQKEITVRQSAEAYSAFGAKSVSRRQGEGSRGRLLKVRSVREFTTPSTIIWLPPSNPPVEIADVRTFIRELCDAARSKIRRLADFKRTGFQESQDRGRRCWSRTLKRKTHRVAAASSGFSYP